MRANRTYKHNKDWQAAKVDPKVFLVGAVIGLIIMIAIGTAMGKELVNTATNEIAEVQDMGKRDVLEEIYAELDSKAQDTESTFILVEQEDESVTLFTINYPYEDYADTDLPMVELGTYKLMELVN